MVSKKDKNLLLLVAAYIRRRVWNARCALIFDKLSITPDSILISVKKDVRLHIRADFVRLNLNSFRKKYAKFNSLVSIRDGTLHFSL